MIYRLIHCNEDDAMQLANISDAIEDIRRGRFVILVDDEDRENEGDLVIAAEKITPESINFMATYGRGLICLAMATDIADRLDLPLMVEDNQAPFQTAFTISIDAAHGISNGISARDRAHTILTAVADNSRSQDLIVPGHIFPLRARKGGVLVRSGQTEGSVDLARLAGLKPAGVICEIMNDDGTMSRLPTLLEFGAKHNIKVASVAELIRFRLQKESFVTPVASACLPTPQGEFTIIAYSNELDDQKHIVLKYGELNGGVPVPVRVHAACVPGDVFSSIRCECRFSLDYAMEYIARRQRGVILYLQKKAEGKHVLNKIRRYGRGEEPEPQKLEDREMAFRDYGIGAQILRHLGLTQIEVITNRPKQFKGLSGYGLQIVKWIPASHCEEDKLECLGDEEPPPEQLHETIRKYT